METEHDSIKMLTSWPRNREVGHGEGEGNGEGGWIQVHSVLQGSSPRDLTTYHESMTLHLLKDSPFPKSSTLESKPLTQEFWGQSGPETAVLSQWVRTPLGVIY